MGHPALFSCLGEKINCSAMDSIPQAELGLLQHWKRWARAMRYEARAVYRASKDPRVPWYAKALAVCVFGYLLSPIDLIPDFIPVLGYLDDLIIVPAGLLLAIRLIPAEVMQEYREAARKAEPQSPLGDDS